MRSYNRVNQITKKTAAMMIKDAMRIKELLTNQLTNILKRKAESLTLGLSLRQWTAVWLICLILMPVFTAPISAAAVWSQPVKNEYSHLEPVNPPQPIWKEAKLKFDLAMERWFAPTPLRITVAESPAIEEKKDIEKIAEDKESAKTAKKSLIEEADETTETEKSADSIAVDKAISNEGKTSEILPLGDKPQTAAALKNKANAVAILQPVFVNQLPADERESVYNYQNNLGAPPGQVEADSTNKAAAIKIKHRAGIANFSFGIPLAGLSGRGINAGVGMTYNSRTWNKSCTQYDTQANCVQNHFTYDVDQSWIAPGFSSGFGYLNTYLNTRNVNMMNGSNTVNKTLTEIIPEGIIEADGTRRQISCKTSSQIPGGHSSAQYCTAFETADGSLIKVNRSGSTYSIAGTVNYSNTSFTIIYPNGSKAFYGTPFGSGNNRKHYPYIIQDSNGNRIRITYKDAVTGRIDHINDTLNRKIKFYYENDELGNPDKLVTVTIPGMTENSEIQTVRFYYETMNLNAASAFTGDITAPASIRVLRHVYFPGTNTGFKYDYHPNYGMIKKITRKVGMTVSDATSTIATGTVTDINDDNWAAKTEYNFPDGSAALADVPKYTKRTDDWKDRNVTTPAQETFYDFPESTGGDSISRITVRDTDFDVMTKNVSNGLIKETSVFKLYGPIDAVTNQRPYSTLMAKTAYFWTGRNLTKTETTDEAGLIKANVYGYDQYNNQTYVKEYDYAATGILGTLLRQTDIDYVIDPAWIGNNLLGLVKSVKTTVGGSAVSKTIYEYDHNGNDSPLTLLNDIDDSGTHDISYNPSHQPWTETVCPKSSQSSGDGCVTIYHPGYTAASAYRGNVTRVGRMLDALATTITDTNSDKSDYNYDIAGNLVSATLSCCQLKTFEYGTTFGETGYAYPVKETKGEAPEQLTSEAVYNKNTGLVTLTKDENGQETEYQYEADTLRQKKVIYPNDGYTETEYSDKLAGSAGEMVPGFVRTKTLLDTNETVQSYSYFDGRGLGIRSATETATNGWSVSAIEYDSLGRARKSYNPFYAAAPNGAIPAGTKYTQAVAIDAFGRTTQVKLQDETTVSTEFSNQTTTPANFNKTFATITDQAGKKRRQVIDSLGRVVRVDEPIENPGDGDPLGAVATPHQPTVYEYDGNDNLKKVVQTGGGVTQTREFKYDSLSRMTHERQVEAIPTLNEVGEKVQTGGLWTKYLKYNQNGLLEFGRDSRGIKTTFGYDGLNRVETVTYSDDTPAVTYTYDQARTGFFNKGALTRVETALGGATRPDTPATATEFDYDLMGRVKKHRQSIGTQTYNLEYGYNLAGQLTSKKYPSGRTVAIDYDAKGRMASVADTERTYLSGLQYQGKGNSLNSMTLGNGTTQTFTLNDRLQMTNQTLTKGANVIQKYDYGYGQIDASGNLDLTKNNGQLARVESHIGTAKQWTKKYLYDSIGRLSKEEEYRGDNSALVYRNQYDYDNFGNLYREQAKNANALPGAWIEQTNISKSTNKLTTGTTYDDAGNVTTDTKFRDSNFSYDANGRMFKTSRTDNTVQANSVYDASGMRVATKLYDVWQFYIYDAFGQKVAEYGGLQGMDEGGVKYVLSDWQGSTRAVLNNTGVVNARIDYTAFGEEIQAGTGQRTTQQGFGANNNLKNKYALTERDEATGLDHTWFRKNENKAGRWTSPDPYNGSMSLGNPQSFNRYAYVGNDPLNFIDPSGLNAQAPGEACSYSGKKDANGDPVYDGTIDANGRCRSHAGSTVIVSAGGWGSVLGGNSGINTIINPREPINIGGGGGGGNTSSVTARELYEQKKDNPTYKKCMAMAQFIRDKAYAAAQKAYDKYNVDFTFADTTAAVGGFFLGLAISNGNPVVGIGVGFITSKGGKYLDRFMIRWGANMKAHGNFLGNAKRCLEGFPASELIP
jgi:RHS repeat-associated protein